MAIRGSKLIIFLCFLGLILINPHGALSGPIPNSTQDILKILKLDSAILAGLEEELKVPKDWVEKARREGKVRVRGTPATSKQLRELFAPFKERYPFIDIDYFGANRQSRTIKTLMAYKNGRILTDLLMSIGGFFAAYKEANALEDLHSIPTWNAVPEEARGADGLWVSRYRLYWCMAYNKRLVRKEDLPMRWEDILTNPIWRGGNLALGNRPNLWIVNLWKDKGEHWTKNFLTRLFTEVKPQLRKEGMNALPQLVAAGEFHASIPTSYRRAYGMVLEGAPVGFTCPEPVPATFSDTVILKRAPNIHAAKILLNWLLSKEGQLAYYYSNHYAPVHKDLLRKEFLPFADKILGRKTSYWYKGESDLERKIQSKAFESWNDLWLRGGGKLRR